MENVVSVESLTRRFGEVTAVDQLSFEVHPQEIFGLLGPNGAGKTTTLLLLIGLLGLDEGVVRIMGFDPQVQARQVRQHIGYVPQETNMYLDLNAVDNLWHHAALYCRDLSIIGNKIQELLKLMNLWERRGDPVRTYSGGMKRRLALARTLLHDPEVIFFDEPTLGVDVQGKYVIWEHIQDQRDGGKTFIISTNDMMEADRLCDRLLIIDSGSAITLDTPENLKAGLGQDIVTLHTSLPIEEPYEVFQGIDIRAVMHPQPGVVRFETSNAETMVAEIVNRVKDEYHLEAIRIARPSLDDVFLEYTGRGLRD
jgi:ABC-2 type transport system ATP-binding protein